MVVKKADLSQVNSIARLFDLYRQFYECAPDIELATQYIQARLENEESTIFVAMDNDEVAGFVQLYPTYCSIAAARIFVLYDLFVDEPHRKKGVGETLMNKARDYAKETGAVRLDLLTENTNTPGQRLYEKIGYERVNENFYAYSLELTR